jgi:inorganic pyrophosphatase
MILKADMIFPPVFSKDAKNINAVIETPQGSRNKYKYNQERNYYELSKVLPAGTAFPLDFGFIPYTKGQDGDPLDVMVISDVPFFPGCIVQARIIGVLLCEQKEPGQKPVRNDRFISVSAESLAYSDLSQVTEVNKNLLNELIHFFEYYNRMEGKEFRLLKIMNRQHARELIKENARKVEKEKFKLV